MRWEILNRSSGFFFLQSSGLSMHCWVTSTLEAEESVLPVLTPSLTARELLLLSSYQMQ